MDRVAVRNLTRETQLADRALYARDFWTRGRGMLARPAPEAGEGMVLEPCSSVHMFGMRYALDVVFADRQARVARLVDGLKPWRFSPVVRGAHYAIELPVGTIAASRTEVGDQLQLEEAA